jgi:outer membrane receptor for ferrienterochelin and colicin
MKKIVVLLTLLTMSTLALADKKGYFYGVKYDHKNSIGGTDANTYGMEFGKHVYDWLDVKVATNYTDKEGRSKGNSYRLEAGPKFKYKLNTDWSTSLFLATGQKFVKDDDYGYWVVTPGVKYKLSKDWSLGTSVRWRNSYNTSHEQQDTTYAVKLGYQFGPNTVLDTRYRIKRGDSDYNELGLGLTFDF